MRSMGEHQVRAQGKRCPGVGREIPSRHPWLPPIPLRMQNFPSGILNSDCIFGDVPTPRAVNTRITKLLGCTQRPDLVHWIHALNYTQSYCQAPGGYGRESASRTAEIPLGRFLPWGRVVLCPPAPGGRCPGSGVCSARHRLRRGPRAAEYRPSVQPAAGTRLEAPLLPTGAGRAPVAQGLLPSSLSQEALDQRPCHRPPVPRPSPAQPGTGRSAGSLASGQTQLTGF